MAQIIIGVAANERKDSGQEMGHMPISYNPSGYIKAVQLVGGLPIMIPIGDPNTVKTYVSMIDKLILAGGQNVAPEFYGEVELIEYADYNRERDAFELALVNEAIRQGKPILGVCRGMQLVNVALGGTIKQKIKGHWQTENFQLPVHPINIESDSVLEKIYGKKVSVNSFHRQAVKQVANQLKIVASSEDGIIEAVESSDPEIHFLGVQWHPDFMYSVRKEDLNIFRYAVHQL
ncbi:MULTISPECIES: gamma-glutamyl-gamma-aminobutyrate hydrolase family protein [unclassified Enterococcus]|uniref:gamma-glutamyl-gamma-aminobutyrate hydrolase family protein n=1 Tax=unclassified Enterococcus TaxID=2608891 RepID=UPI0015549736|nr:MULTISPECIES: gamma-glutamyl-gamma-aminobutyrate hydrolase family protein [unclassified Enterococcus]MBS7577436.1 gamma-glutamyl-gamma-aminobutyrate hydrolase family protein [Enterococcus sp. MMGLQ5-2]MBS7584843.1 gamma-glutamyl-gamma-aminobutyrate hydrolase family protein [Enterococcus sp. MMGLQ5-1]NPD12698.1 gamma-glutamyl-gamma-aminobutyrate hydrolase family protein [Enterococcus sp. MMGLQ5-1]NPD37270.1 gamma-glutamyl-gamma-aminobutyrate hydrolase family protein [Enterococcus sp. MMGLQ5-2